MSTKAPAALPLPHTFVVKTGGNVLGITWNFREIAIFRLNYLA